MIENENIEFKQDFTENIYKEVIAFLNTNAGTIYIGYDDNGNLLGISDAKKIEEKLSNGIKNLISPDCSIFVSINVEEKDGKEYIVIKVSKGIDIYFLTQKGIVKGTYLRTGSCSMQASEETIKQMILKNSNISFETSISNNQKLTFSYAEKIFDEKGINIRNKNIKKNLNLLTDIDMYTNLALLISDQNPFNIKVAVYQNTGKEHFLDRKEFNGSVFEIYEKVCEYLELNSATYGIIKSSRRIDIEEYPKFIIREILLNSIIHRDYSTLTSNIINIYKDTGIEFINYGSLYGNITIEDILEGLSTTRNPHLQSLFMRLEYVEAIGSGLKRVNEYYNNLDLKMEIKALPASFIVKLPKIEANIENTNVQYVKLSDKDRIIKYIKENGFITRKECEKIIEKEKTATLDLLNQLINDKYIVKKGNSRTVRYEIRSDSND